jgi:hypothetical protein
VLPSRENRRNARAKYRLRELTYLSRGKFENQEIENMAGVLSLEENTAGI